MGIVNVTPDSFSDGGRFFNAGAACAHAEQLIEAGAHIVDIGGESTRPGADPVSQQHELQRVIPVVRELRRQWSGIISVDTTKASVARAALEAGADMINDISAGRFDPQMAAVAAAAPAGVILMHSRKKPATMQHNPSYSDTVAEVSEELLVAAKKFLSAGVDKDKIILDPGIGFAKTLADNIALLSHCHQLCGLGFELCLGVSRKSFIGSLSTQSDPSQRLAGSLAAIVPALMAGVRMFRVHDVAETAQFIAVAGALGIIANNTV